MQHGSLSLLGKALKGNTASLTDNVYMSGDASRTGSGGIMDEVDDFLRMDVNDEYPSLVRTNIFIFFFCSRNRKRHWSNMFMCDHGSLQLKGCSIHDVTV